MDIVFSRDNNDVVMVLPVVPEVEISEGQLNETFEGLSFNIRMLGNRELKTMSISSFFPSKKYPFVNAYAEINPQAYVDFFLQAKADKIPIRLVVTDKRSREVLNIAVSVDSFIYKYRVNGDIDYTLDLTEYVFIGVEL